jgi:protein SCO1/2
MHARSRPHLALVWLVLAVVAVGCTARTGPPGERRLDSDFAYAEQVAAPPLDLTDHDGQPFTLASLRGTPILIYFGYTHCPDVCPATIGVLNKVVASVDDPLRILIVTVDPERDTVASLAEYARFLTDEYIALTGTASEIRTAASGYGVTYARVETGSASGYSMAHTAETYLVDRAGRLVAHYPFGTAAEPIARDLDALGAH